MKLQNQKVIVIGGSSGMGLGISEMAAREGAEVIIASRDLAKCQAAAQRLGARASGLAVDTTDEESVRELFARAGTVHHVLIPGSTVKTGPVKATPAADVLDSLRSKFLGPVLCARAATFAPGGSLTLFSGILSRKPGNSSLLAAINAAVESLAKGLAIELAPVRVNAISPGMTKETNAYAGMPEAAREAMFSSIAAKLPIGRVGTPADIAEAALFLMTCGFVNGVVLDVDGGGLLL